MLTKSHLTACLVMFLILSAVQENHAQPKSSKAVRLEPAAVPSRAFSISGEVLALRATGEAKGTTNRVSVSLEPLRQRFGKFKQATVYEFNPAGKRVSQKTLNVSDDGSVRIDATSGNFYLAYAELGKVYNDSYRFACNLSVVSSRVASVPEICSQIFCTNEPIWVKELENRFPTLVRTGVLDGLSGAEIGGFGRGPITGPTSLLAVPMPVGGGNFGGGICKTCEPIRPGMFGPVGQCSLELPITGELLPGPIVYHRIYYTDNDSRGPTQIFKLGDGSSEPVNLSRDRYSDHDPDVNPDGQQIVFARGDEGLFIMNINGENLRAVPNTQLASHPKWILNPDPYILYIRGNGNINYVRPDGTGNNEVTRPGNRLSDVHVDRYDGRHIIFERRDQRRRFDPDIFGLDVFGNGYYDSDLFIKPAFDADQAPTRLTDTPDTIEALPTGANQTERLVAYSVFSPANPAAEVRVARIEFDNTLTVLHTIRLAGSADTGINGISFSKDDSMLLISTRSRTQGNVVEARKYELYSVNLDGTNLNRITNNLLFDAGPSAIYVWAPPR